MERLNDPRRYSVALDAYVADKDKLADIVFLESLLWRVAREVGMTILNVSISNIKEDIEKLGKDAFEDEGGYSLQALITTSHIALHVWPNRSLFMFDLVSCRPFDASLVIGYLKYYFSVSSIEFLQVVNNGFTVDPCSISDSDPRVLFAGS